MRIKIAGEVKGDRRKGVRNPFVKKVMRVGLNKNNGYAFEGEFLPCDREFEIDEGSIVLINAADGSWKYPDNTAYVCRVERREGELTYNVRKHENLVVLDEFDYVGQFLSLRDYVASLVNSDVEREKLLKRKAELEAELEKINKVLEGKVESPPSNL